MYKKSIQFPIGTIVIVEDRGKIIKIDKEEHNICNDIEEKDTEILLKAEKQLNEYFQGKRFQFDLPLNPVGTDFMKNVWKVLKEIPYGETRTYKEIAEMVGNYKASRAVGMANNKNPIPIIIPCHRVIGSNNKLVGYALGLEMKQYLLELERKYKERKWYLDV